MRQQQKNSGHKNSNMETTVWDQFLETKFLNTLILNKPHAYYYHSYLCLTNYLKKISTKFFSEENETEEDNVRSSELCLLAKLGQKNLMSHCHENGIDMVKILS
jgi:hypothetical protein